MLHTFFQTLPCFTCLALAIAYSVIKRKTPQQRYYTEFLYVTSAFYFTNMGLVLHSSHIELNIILYLLWVFTSLISFSILMVFVGRGSRLVKSRLYYQAMFMISFFITVSLTTLYCCIIAEGKTDLIQIPPDSTAMEYNDAMLTLSYYIGEHLYKAIALLYVTSLLIILVIHLFRRRKHMAFAWKKGGALTEKDSKAIFIFIFLASGVIKVSLGRVYLESHPYVSDLFNLLISIALCASSLSGLINLEKDQSRLYDIVLDKEQEKLLEIKESEMETVDKADNEPEMLSKQQEALLERFHNYFTVGMAYLDPDMNIEKVTVEVNSNRTYVSSLINKVYGMPFRNLLNKRRIEEAKAVMKEHPDWVLEDVAVKSGFTSASQLSRKFKEEEGLTPREWLKAKE
jgi:AraC-type DNA-binding domain-containing proteins